MSRAHGQPADTPWWRSLDEERVLALVTQPAWAERAAAELLRRIRHGHGLSDAGLTGVASFRDLSRAMSGGTTGPLPVSRLRAAAWRAFERRQPGRQHPLCPPHEGVVLARVLDGHDGEVRDLRALDPHWLLSADDQGRRVVWDLRSGRAVARLRRGDGAGDGVVLRWRAGGLTVDGLGHGRGRAVPVPVPACEIGAVTTTRFAAVRGHWLDADVVVHEVASGDVVWSGGGYSWDRTAGDAPGLTLSPCGRFLAIEQGLATHVDIVDLHTRAIVPLDSGHHRRCFAAFGPGPVVLVHRRDRLDVVDPVGGAVVTSMDDHVEVATPGATPGWLACGRLGAVELRDADGHRAWSRVAPGQVDALAVGAAGEVSGLVRGEWDPDERAYRSTAIIWDRAGREIGRIECARALSPVGPFGRFATGGRWGTVFVWNTNA